jgi:hypothetical protein
MKKILIFLTVALMMSLFVSCLDNPLTPDGGLTPQEEETSLILSEYQGPYKLVDKDFEFPDSFELKGNSIVFDETTECSITEDIYFYFTYENVEYCIYVDNSDVEICKKINKLGGPFNTYEKVEPQTSTRASPASRSTRASPGARTARG